MNDIAMKGYSIRSLQYSNNITGTETLEIGTNVESKVNYNDDASECRCSFIITVKDTGEKNLLCVVLAIDAVFSFSPGENKKAIHVKINENLFAQARATVCAICGVVGIPPIMFPQVAFTEADTIEIKPSDQIPEQTD